MQVVKRSPQDTDLMVTPDCPSRKREMNWGCICSTAPGREASPQPAVGACHIKRYTHQSGSEHPPKNITEFYDLKYSLDVYCIMLERRLVFIILDFGNLEMPISLHVLGLGRKPKYLKETP